MRLFTALALPEPLCEALGRLALGLPGARPVPADNLHLTLRFIGEVPGPVAEDVDLALSSLHGKGFSLELCGVGVSERSLRPVALWAGVARNRALEHLQSKIEFACQRAGLAPHKRRFMPHVTLARLDNTPPDKLAAWVQAHSLLRAPPAAIDHFTLFSSRLGKENSVYTPEAEYRLH